ncbi:MAG: YncE family protein [Sphingomonadales bacterium]|nr:YncE family protein [Sphingomonadales bacterium]MDE2568396.1 YncE family protein [Sphingomonadales bacterium]
MRKLIVSASLVVMLAACHKPAEPGPQASGSPSAASETSAFTVTHVSLPGEGRGDYLLADSEGRRLYVTHGARLHIIDLDTLKPVGEVDGLKYAHGVALDKARGHGFVTDGDLQAVVMFDLSTGKTIKMIPAGKKPDSILFDPASGMIFAFNGDSKDVSVIDPAIGKVVSTIKLPNGPEFSQTDGKGKIWVNLEEGNDIAVIDAKAMKLSGTIPLPGCDGPAPLAFDAANRVLFSGCGNKVMAVTDADSGKVLTTVPIGGGPDGIAFDPGRKRILVANRDGAWTIVTQDAKDKYTVSETLPIDEYAKTVTVDTKTHRAFSSTADLVWPKPAPGQKLLPNAKPGTFRLMVVSEK